MAAVSRRVGPIVIVSLLFFLGLTTTTDAALVHYAWVDERDVVDYINEMAERFHEQTGIEVEVIVGGARGYDSYLQQFVVFLLAGQVPDVVHISASETWSYDVLADINEFIERDADISIHDYPPAARLSDDSFRPGALAGLPATVWWWGAAYNQTLFDEMGLGEIDPAWTWDDLEGYTRKLAYDADGDGYNDIFGLELPAYWIRWLPVIHHAGGSFFDRVISPRESRLTSEPVVRGFEFISQLHETGGVQADWLRFLNGNVGITYDAGANLGELLERAQSNFEFEYRPFAKGPSANTGGDVNMGVGGAANITQASNNKEEAWEWLKFLWANEENLARFSEISGRLPAYHPAMERYVTDRMDQNGFEHLFAILVDPTSYQRPSDMPAGVGGLIEQWMRRALVNQEISVFEALTQADRLVSAMLSQ